MVSWTTSNIKLRVTLVIHVAILQLGVLRSLAGIGVLWIDLDGAILFLDELARLDHVLEHNESTVVVVGAILLLLKLELSLLQSEKLLLDLDFGGRLLHPLLFHLLVCPPPLHAGADHADANALLSYKVKQ